MHRYWEVTQEIDKLEGNLKLDTYAAPHVWNLVAKILRERYALLTVIRTKNTPEVMHRLREIEMLALQFAERFRRDEGFDHLAWLDQCSPDPERYPFSELWENK